MRSNWRSYFLVPSIIFLSAVAGGVFGPGLADVSAASNQTELDAAMKTFSKVYDLVEQNFADKVAADKTIYKGAIPGMLRTLDPHSSFFDPRDFNLLREDQKGHYFGVGMTVAPKNNRTMVIAPFPGSPAYKAGIRPGDLIMFVNDKSTENLRTDEVADLLKGPKGTAVQVIMQREGNPQPLTFNIIRDEIPRKSVQDAIWLDREKGIAFLDIESFNENTSKEVEENLRRLGESIVKGLILDLRENPGGLLNEGVAVADRWLERGQTVVKHSGRSSPERKYDARHGNAGRNYPIVVLVNRYSASAAEIVSGALQDHDRAWIFGENTFGKGLVQTVFPLAENTGLALTTARYYTPSNRLIQRDYSHSSFFDYYYRKNLEQKNLNDVGLTDTGRKVYGGGGISPDEKYEIPKLTRLGAALLRSYSFLNFTAQYLSTHDRKGITKEWAPDQGFVSDFKQYLLKEGFEFTEADWTESETYIKAQLRKEVFTNAFSMEDSRQMNVLSDPMVIRAVESLPKAKELLEKARKMLVQRRAPRD